MKIILISGRAGSGKDTVADLICSKKQYTKMAFAFPVKQIATDLCEWDGIKDKYGRALLIFVGRYLGAEITKENYISDILCYDFYNYGKVLDGLFTPKKEFFPELLLKRAIVERAETIVVSDFRFRKEYYYLKQIIPHITTIRINREVSIIDDQSENDLEGFNFDITIDNNGAIEELKERIDRIGI